MTATDNPFDMHIACVAKMGASDCTFDPADDGSLAVVARIDGFRSEVARVPADLARSCVARAKALARLPAYIGNEPQDGRIDAASIGVAGDLRLAVIPTIRGERMAVRLPAIGNLPEVDALGLPPQAVDLLRRVFAKPQGLIVLCGPTGAGKTTTASSFCVELAQKRSDKVIISLEDPAERRLPGVIQVELAPDRGFDGPTMLEAVLRQDPDVILFGELRSKKAADTAVQAALSGHLVIATLHCGRALEAVPRLLDLGVAEETLLPALELVVAQRLLRRQHAACGGKGCPECVGGYLGRVPAFDILPIDRDARVALADGQTPCLPWQLPHMAAALVADRLTGDDELLRSGLDPATLEK